MRTAGPSSGAGRDELNLSGNRRPLERPSAFSFAWRDDLQSLHLTSKPSTSHDINTRRRPAQQRRRTFLMWKVNARLWIGHFDLWPEDGTIVFRHAMIFPDARASASQCEALLNLALEACEHYYPAFQFVLWGNKTAEEAVAAAVLECAGQA